MEAVSEKTRDETVNNSRVHHLDMHLRIVGVYKKKITQVRTGSRRPPTSFFRSYVVLSYNGERFGKLAISDLAYDEMRDNGAELIRL